MQSENDIVPKLIDLIGQFVGVDGGSNIVTTTSVDPTLSQEATLEMGASKKLHLTGSDLTPSGFSVSVFAQATIGVAVAKV